MEAVVDLKYRPVFPNGGVAAAAAAKKTRLGPGTVAGGETAVYRECLKNHAASLGGHVLDGCGEFMPSPEADPADPGSLRCAACGCHRNFHRRHRLSSPPLLSLPPPPPPLVAPAVASHAMPVRDSRTMSMRGEEAAADDRLPSAFDDETEDEDEESDDGSSDFDEDRPLSPPPPVMGPPGYLQAQAAAAPHVLLGLSTGLPGSQTPPRPAATHNLGPMPAPPGTSPGALAARTKRARTKFSAEQKQRMRALSERLGWRLQKRDEAVVEECCHEMGVTKAVFKVWMHNNKHNFVAGHSARRSASSSASAAAIVHHPSSSGSDAAAAAAAVYPSSYAAPAPAPAPPAAAVHTSAYTAAAAPAAPPVHADFNINGTAAAADYFRVQPSMASGGGSPQSS